MQLGLADKGAIVTGGRTGIGAAVARALAAEGCHVAIVDREEAQETVSAVRSLGRKSLHIQADVASHDEALRAVERARGELGRLDILVCNAGITWDGVLWTMTEEQWDCVLDINLKGTFNYNKAAARIFKDQKSGRIVNVSSINGLRGKFAQGNYAASKAGIIALTKTLARELGKFHVTVNAIAPGLVMTEMAGKLPPEVLKKAMDETALGRFADPEDVADLVVFLASDRARHITGTVIQIDGGQYI